MGDQDVLELLRNIAEHWDQAGGRSERELGERYPTITPAAASYVTKEIWLGGSDGVQLSRIKPAAGPGVALPVRIGRDRLPSVLTFWLRGVCHVGRFSGRRCAAVAGGAGAPTSPAPSQTPSTPASVNSSALPSWLLVSLLIVVIAIIAAMFALTFYNLSAPRSTLKNVLGIKPRLPGRGKPNAGETAIAKLYDKADDKQAVSQKVLDTLSLSARVGKRTTRTTLAITGFALLGLILVALFGLSGSDVHDLRTQTVAALTTLVATIAGFYFGSQGGGGGGGSAPTESATAQRAISEIVPATGVQAGGEHVAILGSGLSTAAKVTLGGTEATAVRNIGETALSVVTPASTTSGAADVVIVFADGSQINRPGGFTFS